MRQRQFSQNGRLLSGPLLDERRPFADWPQAFSDTVEALLANELDDTEECQDLSGTWGDEAFSDPRVCDMAAFVLAQRWPQKYQFTISAKQAVRDRQRIAIANQWREGHDLPPLPPLEQRVIVPAPDKQMKPLLAALLSALDDDVRRAAVARIEDVGLPAIKSVRAALLQLSENQPARKALTSVERRLALMVYGVTLDVESVPADDELGEQIAALRNKPITSDAIVELIVRVTTHLPRGATGIEFKASRAGDDTGVLVIVKLCKHRIRQAGSQKGWDTRYRLSSDQRASEAGISPALRRDRRSGYEDARRAAGMHSDGMVSKEYGQTPEAFQQLAGALDYLFESAPDRSFKIDLSIIEEE